MNGIKDKVAFISGTGCYIGGEVALRLAKEGAKIAAADINEAAVGPSGFFFVW